MSHQAYPKSVIDEAAIHDIAMSLPGVVMRPSYGGRPSYRTPGARGTMFTWIRESPVALVLWVSSLDAKDAMIEGDPETFFTTPHYNGLAMVLARLEALDSPRARALITESFRLRGGAPAPSTNKPARANSAKANSAKANSAKANAAKANAAESTESADGLPRSRPTTSKRRATAPSGAKAAAVPATKATRAASKKRPTSD